MDYPLSRPGIVFLDAWHTLFTVRVHGPQRMAQALRSLGHTVADDRLQAALVTARERLKQRDMPFVATPEHEQAYYRVYHGLVLDTLAIGDGEALVDRLTEAAHYVPHCILYADTAPALQALRQAGYRLGLLSNAYPSLIDALTSLDILDYFDVQVVSAFEGCEKPDPAIYHAALRLAGVAPEQALFVDDLPENIEAANAVGMVGVLIDRDDQHADTPLRRITRLTELLPLLGPNLPKVQQPSGG